ncbi:MAG: lyase family protein [Sulfitobacter sp.]|uniref:lyase family protein n=1 Tax=Roseibium sp. TaxID=1936156 RepID=UPI0032651684
MDKLLSSFVVLSKHREELECYVDIDIAHLAMLDAAELVPRPVVTTLVRAAVEMRAVGFEDLDGTHAPRGLYMAYQAEIARRAGPKNARFLHTGRSRNDLNATVFLLRMRGWLCSSLKSLDRLRATLLERAFDLGEAPLPVMSQYQIAGPGQAWHYLASIEGALAVSREAFRAVSHALEICPMGAGAGVGTSLPIRPEITASYLGFSYPVDLSLRAVGGREAGPLFANAASTAAIVVGRTAQDMQVWMIPGVDVLDLPNRLSGMSSMLPHKRNPFLLEHLKSLSASVMAKAGECGATCLKVPLANSVEVSGYLPSLIEQQNIDFDRLCALAAIVVEGLELCEVATSNQHPEINAQVLVEQRAMSTGQSVALELDILAKALRNTKETKNSAELELLAAFGDASANLRYGGGPGTSEWTKIVARQARALARHRSELEKLQRPWVDASVARHEFAVAHGAPHIVK